MNIRLRHVVVIGTLTVLGVGAGTAAVAAATGGESETPIVGAELERATGAALAHTGQGRVTETEVGDEDSYYEVEVTLDDGSQVDVQLDKDFMIVGATADHEGSEASDTERT
jgi:hypothetical protein